MTYFSKQLTPESHFRSIKLVTLILILNYTYVMKTMSTMVHLSENERPLIVDPKFVDEVDFTTLWYGDISKPTMRQKKEVGIDKYKVTMVVSHCDKSIEWIWRDFIPHQFHIPNVIVYSKCGNAVEGAPPDTTIVHLPNVGRCDHTYAYHMAQMNFTNTSSLDEIILFLKDNPRRLHGTRSLENLLHIASVNGFGCIEQIFKWEDFRPSYYHDYSALSTFSLEGWIREERDKNDEFESGYKNLGDWINQLHIELPTPLVPVCYGGTFAATVSQISKQRHVWSQIEENLSRGDNIEEGHFCERVWAGLLSKPLSAYGVKVIQEKSTEIMLDNGIFFGTLGYYESIKYSLLVKILVFNCFITLMCQLFFKISRQNKKR